MGAAVPLRVVGLSGYRLAVQSVSMQSDGRCSARASRRFVSCRKVPGQGRNMVREARSIAPLALGAYSPRSYAVRVHRTSEHGAVAERRAVGSSVPGVDAWGGGHEVPPSCLISFHFLRMRRGWQRTSPRSRPSTMRPSAAFRADEDEATAVRHALHRANTSSRLERCGVLALALGNAPDTLTRWSLTKVISSCGQIGHGT